MNYLKHYIKLIRNAQNRNLPKEIYTEKHHIFPSSIFGKNNKTVRLTAREHVVSHFLLWKACKKRYGDLHYRTIKMFYAFNAMTWNPKLGKRNTSLYYKYAKETQSMLMKIRMPSKTPEARKKISENKRGKNRKDLVGKKFFGTTKDISEIKSRAHDSRKKTIEKNREMFGYGLTPCKHKRIRKSPAEESRMKASGSYKNRIEMYKTMTEEEVVVWLKNKRYINDNGKTNPNINRLLGIRNETPEKYGLL